MSAAPLDEDARALLERVAANPPPAPGSVPIAEFRQGARKLIDISGPPEPMAAVEEIDIGGGLAAVTALAARDGGGPPLAAQVLLYPNTDATLSSPSIEELAEGRMLTRAALEFVFGQYMPDAAARTDPRVSPLLAETHAGLPPAIVVTAGHDPVRDDGARYVERLESAEVPVCHLPYPGTIHNFMLIVDALAVGREATAEVGLQLRDALRNARNPP